MKNILPVALSIFATMPAFAVEKSELRILSEENNELIKSCHSLFDSSGYFLNSDINSCIDMTDDRILHALLNDFSIVLSPSLHEFVAMVMRR
jgi:hypothetical protein